MYIVKVCEDGKLLGYFIGERLWRGFWILAAPWDGVGSYTQGLKTINEISEFKRLQVYKELANWVFTKKIASLLQIDDWQLRRETKEWIPYEEFKQEEIERADIQYSVRPTLVLPISGKTEEELWNGLHYKSCKYCVNKAKKLGLYVREIIDYNEIDAFTKQHYQHLVNVCHRHGMRPKPSQSQKRMNILCKSLYPDRVIMLECRGKDENGIEQSMSTAIYGLDKGECIYWTGASYERYMKYCPNELMVWEAIRILRQKGAGTLNYGGMATYKLKFGTIYAYVPRIIFTKHQWLWKAKDFAKRTYHCVRKTMGRI